MKPSLWLRDRRPFTLAVAMVCGIAFVVFVWPTRYRYEHLTQARFSYFARFDRFSDRVQTLTGTEWLPKDETPDFRRVRDSAYTAGWQAGTAYLVGISNQLALPDTACLRVAVKYAADLSKDSATAQQAGGVIRRYCYESQNPFRR